MKEPSRPTACPLTDCEEQATDEDQNETQTQEGHERRTHSGEGERTTRDRATGSASGTAANPDSRTSAD
jgi:hypothetical protein